MRSRCWCMMYSGLCHLAVCIEADITMVVSTLVGHEHRWTVIVEMPSVVVRVHCKRPAAFHATGLFPSVVVLNWSNMPKYQTIAM